MTDLRELSVAHERARRVNEKLRRELGAVVCGFLEEAEVIEVMLNPDGRLWVERLGQPMIPAGTMSATQAESLMATVAATLRTTLTRDNPILECELPLDGSRFEAWIPPVVTAPTFTLRRKAAKVFGLADYVAAGIMTAGQRRTLEAAVEDRRNLLVVSGTGTGKTTLTNALIAAMVAATPAHRLFILEDTAEIQCAAENAVILHATDQVDLLRLLKTTLRGRPDRILVGEVRGGAEALALLKAWNTGHPGGVATVHANHVRAGLHRLEQLIAEVTQAPMQALIAAAVDLVVSMVKDTAHPAGRRIEEIVAVEGVDSTGYVFSTVE
jgi:type IV secretion system protein VirB11